MSPHEFDRYRIMGYLLRQARESMRLGGRMPRKITQKDLAKRVDVSQTSISNLEGFDRLATFAGSVNKPTTRETLIKVATTGLNLRQHDVEMLLWLFDGEDFQPLKEWEIRSCQAYDKHAYVGRYDDPVELREHTLFLIDKWLTKKHIKGPRSVEARIITDWSEASQLEFRDELRRMEEGSGQRMMFTKYPSLLTYPHSLRGQSNSTDDLNPSEETREAASTLTDQRREIFIKNLGVYGERCIHSRPSLLRYLSDSIEHRLNMNQRREQIENMIYLLEQYEYYEVALGDVEPETELELKSTVAACLRATEHDTYYPNKKPYLCGPLYVYWYDVTTVFSFYWQFERAWDSIQAQHRNKEFVIAWLKSALDTKG